MEGGPIGQLSLAQFQAQITIPESIEDGGAYIKCARKNRSLTFLVQSATNPDLYFEPRLTGRGLVCDGIEGPCRAWRQFDKGRTRDPCRHVMIVKDRLRRGLVLYSGHPVTSSLGFIKMLKNGMRENDKAGILWAIKKYPDRTAVELFMIWNAIRKNNGITGKRHSTVTARLKDLKDDGLVRVTGYKNNPDSDEPAETYRLVWA